LALRKSFNANDLTFQTVEDGPDTGQIFPSEEIKLSAVIKTLKNAGDAGAEQKALVDCKPINTP
jgi:hypothetical protein